MNRTNLPMIFQSTLPRRERPQPPEKWTVCLDFNPRSREGSDAYNTFATKSPVNFNPRSREGSDGIGMYNLLFSRNFNPRSREGSDLSLSGIASRRKNFNPRSREGSDEQEFAESKSNQISIHAPAKGATIYLKKDYPLHLFQSTLPRRERR